MSEVGESVKKTQKLMLKESEMLKEMGVRASIIYHFKRVQDMRDAIVAKKTFTQFLNSPAGQWKIELVPLFVNVSLQAFPVTEKLYNRVAYKLNVENHLPEDNMLEMIRKYAEEALRLTRSLPQNFHVIKEASKEILADIENPQGGKAAKNIGETYFELLDNQVESLKLSGDLTRESKEAEDAYRAYLSKEISRRYVNNKVVAKNAFFTLFSGASWSQKIEALKKIYKYVKEIIVKKVQAAVQKVKEWESKAKNALKNVGTKAKNALKKAGGAVKNTAKNVGKAVKGAVGKAVSFVKRRK